uniref:Uncharacterized protein n=1 Tax=Nelumbo nucifera TaxID=4432 RepID=A0A822XJA3_NELNU|nr:TPA_asm: hypothetical protein HUJ06_020602 [Nelumbo nucifera]
MEPLIDVDYNLVPLQAKTNNRGSKIRKKKQGQKREVASALLVATSVVASTISRRCIHI